MSADPKSVSEGEIDALIMASFPRGRSRRIITVIGRVAHALEHQQRAVSDDAIFERLRLLVVRGLLVAGSDILRRRHCEVWPAGRLELHSEITRWDLDLEKSLPIDEVIDRVRSRRAIAEGEERDFLTTVLELRLEDAGRYNEALELINGELERRPDDADELTAKALLYHDHLNDSTEALIWIDRALEQASRTRFWLRGTLYHKAWILLVLGRGDELGQVLEQIMAVDLYANINDRGKMRDFVDEAPPGLIRADIVARYNAFCPRDDREVELGDWVGELYQQRFSLDEIIEHVRARVQDSEAEDWRILAVDLQRLLIDRERFDEALQVLDDLIARYPDDSTYAIFKARIYHDHLGETARGLECINRALELALRSRQWRRAALGDKARMLLTLRRGTELGQVLEQIMALQMSHDTHDTPRERDFVDDAPPGFIAADIITRYDEYCPRRA